MSTVNFDQGTSPTSIAAVNIVTRSGQCSRTAAASHSIETITWRPIPAWAVTRSIPIRFSAGSSGRRPRGADPARPGVLFRELRAQRSAGHRPGAAERSRVRMARWALPESVSWSSVQRARRRALGRNHHAFARYCTIAVMRSSAVWACQFCRPPGPGSRAALSESRRGHQRAVVQRRQRVPVVALSPGRGPGSHRTRRCPLPCFGLGAPRIVVSDAGVTFGASSASSDVGHRYQLSDSLVWQKGRHSLRVGFEWEHMKVMTTTVDAGQVTLWSHGAVRQRDRTIPLPASLDSVDGILAPPTEKLPDRCRAGLGSPTWLSSRACPRSLSCLCWSRLAGQLPADGEWRRGMGLRTERSQPRPDQARNCSPRFWEPTARGHRAFDARTFRRRWASPGRRPAMGRRSCAAARVATSIPRPAPTSTISPTSVRFFRRLARAGDDPGAVIVHEGRPLVSSSPATHDVHGGQACSRSARQVSASSFRRRNPGNRDFSIRNDRLHQGAERISTIDRSDAVCHPPQLGVQRELAHAVVVSADAVWRRFVHTFISGIDYNRWNSAGGSVIPPCAGQERNDVTALPERNIFFDTTIGRARYAGLLVRVEKRFAGGPSSWCPTRSAAMWAPTARAPRQPKTLADECLGSTTTTGSRTTVRSRPTTVMY